MPWLAVTERNLPGFIVGEKIPITKVVLDEVMLHSLKMKSLMEEH